MIYIKELMQSRGSMFTGAPHKENQLLRGVPAKTVKDGVSWQNELPLN